MRQKVSFSYPGDPYDFSSVSDDAKTYYRLSLDPSVQRDYQSLNAYYCKHLKLLSGLQRLLENSRRQKNLLLQNLADASDPPAKLRLEKQISEIVIRIAELEKCYALENRDILDFQKAIGL